MLYLKVLIIITMSAIEFCFVLFCLSAEAFVVCQRYAPPVGYVPNMSNPLLDQKYGKFTLLPIVVKRKGGDGGNSLHPSLLFSSKGGVQSRSA